MKLGKMPLMLMGKNRYKIIIKQRWKRLRQ